VQEIDGSMAQLTSALAARTVERDQVFFIVHTLWRVPYNQILLMLPVYIIELFLVSSQLREAPLNNISRILILT